MNLEQWLRDGRRSELEAQFVAWPMLPNRFWSKVSMNTSGCWNWTGSKNRSFNLWYPRFTLDGVSFPAHKVMYLVTYGKVPSEMEIHHECRNTLCVNPFHLRMVTGRENRIMSNGPSGINYRKTHCKRGHPLAGDNLVTYGNPRKRVCKTCQLTWQLRQKEIN